MVVMERLGVMQVIDTLVAAGAERVAINLANRLPRDRYASYLCTTRDDGPLDYAVASHTGRLRLRRQSSFDISAVRRLVRFIREHDIRLLHAHSSALFIARLAAAFYPYPTVIWHAHYGRYTEDRWPVMYRLATSRIGGIITVNQQLADWCVRRLSVSSNNVWYVRNPSFVESGGHSNPATLPAAPGLRIICVANFRPEKDHFTLLRAMTAVVRAVPAAHLILAGKCNDEAYLQRVGAEITALGLAQHVTNLGERHDIPTILSQCDVAVLSSMSEGLPMSLLEYGMAGRPTVATDAGQCAEVLDHGRAGILVPAGNAERLADGLIELLRHPEMRQVLGSRFQKFVNKEFNPDRIIAQICQIYDMVTAHSPRPLPEFSGPVG